MNEPVCIHSCLEIHCSTSKVVLKCRAIVAKWFAALCCNMDSCGFEPHQCFWTSGLQVDGSKRFGCHAELQTVIRYCTSGEYEDHMGEKVCKRSTSALKPWADITRSPKQGFQWPHKKNMCPIKVFKILTKLQK